MRNFKILLLALATTVVFCANAQESRKSVLGVEKITYSSSFSSSDAALVRNQIIDAINKTGRVLVVDRGSSARSALNTNSLLSVNLDQITTSKEIFVNYVYVKGSDGKSKKVEDGRHPYFAATITYTVRITDCQTGAVQAQETYDMSVGGYNLEKRRSLFPSEDAAREHLIHNCINQDEFTILILNTFKLHGKILQIDQVKGQKAKSVIINLGSSDGVSAKQRLEVYKEVLVAGEVSGKIMGEVEVVEVLGNSRCRCKVKSGGNEIQQVISAGGGLTVVSKNVEKGYWGVR